MMANLSDAPAVHIPKSSGELEEVSSEEQREEQFQMKQPTHSILKRIAFVGNYLPRQCGISTFTTDLCEAIARENTLA
jgi:hypothetical protein